MIVIIQPSIHSFYSVSQFNAIVLAYFSSSSSPSRSHTLTQFLSKILFIIIRAVTNVVRYDPGSHHSIGIQTHDMCV